jgi:hypothetical protein
MEWSTGRFAKRSVEAAVRCEDSRAIAQPVPAPPLLEPFQIPPSEAILRILLLVTFYVYLLVTMTFETN